MLRSADGLETVLENYQAADNAESRRLIIGIFLAWSLIVVAATSGLLRWERKQRHSEEMLQRANDELELKVVERTRDLHKLNTQLNLELDERTKTEQALKESEKQLRLLSVRILKAQETERGRIARELHDELSHSLIVIKLGLQPIVNGLGESQSEIKADCHQVAQFIDQAVERRVIASLRRARIPVARIGTVVRKRDGVMLIENNHARPFPRFAVDEVARFFQTRR